ncbi:MAG: Flp pilus assembly protein CpaB [Actinomyces sp.]|nr:Flp pilus assembly protein CpaB [Actinomyces sp.]
MTIVGALATFAAVFSYVNTVSSQVGPMTTVLQLTTDVAELQTITSEHVAEVEIPERWAPETAVRSTEELEGMVASGTYTAGSIVQTGMLESPPGLAQGYREVAIVVDAETGVAGKVRSGDHVDILATIQNEQTGEQTSQVVIQNALVIEVGVVTTTKDEDSSGNFQEGETVPVTFALSAEDALKLTYAESFAVKVRLALRGEGDDAASVTQEYPIPGAQEMPDAAVSE